MFAGSCSAFKLAAVASDVSNRGSSTGVSKSVRRVNAAGAGIRIGEDGSGTKLAASCSDALASASLHLPVLRASASSPSNTSGPQAPRTVAFTLSFRPNALETLPRLVLVVRDRCGRCERREETAERVERVCRRDSRRQGSGVAFSLVAVPKLAPGISGSLLSTRVLLTLSIPEERIVKR